MQFSLIELKDFIAHSISPQSQDIENFKDKINHYLLQLKQQKDEEPQKIFCVIYLEIFLSMIATQEAKSI